MGLLRYVQKGGLVLRGGEQCDVWVLWGRCSGAMMHAFYFIFMMTFRFV
jgi:hypothetical protein